MIFFNTRTPIAKAFVESAVRLNHSYVNYNSGDQIGVSYLHSSTKNGWRQTAARAFLSPIRDRKNLDISLRTWATKLLFNANGDQVKAIKFARNKREYTVKVRKGKFMPYFRAKINNLFKWILTI